MDAFYGQNYKKTMKDMKDCAYIDLDSQNDQMLYNCSKAVGSKIK